MAFAYPATKSVSTTLFVRAHGHRPRGRGNWAFKNRDTGETVWGPTLATYAEAKATLPAGRWEVCP